MAKLESFTQISDPTRIIQQPTANDDFQQGDKPKKQPRPSNTTPTMCSPYFCDEWAHCCCCVCCLTHDNSSNDASGSCECCDCNECDCGSCDCGGCDCGGCDCNC